MRKDSDVIYLPKSGKVLEKTAVYAGQVNLSYAEYIKWIYRTAGQLEKSGILPGERVGILSPNRLEIPILLFAMMVYKAVPVLLNFRDPLPKLREALQRVNARKLIVSTELNSTDTLLNTIPLKNIIDLEKKSTDANLKTPGKLALDLQQPATVVFTSGSSGEPKAALHLMRNHYFSALGSNQNIPFETGDVWLLSLPLFHVGGLAILFRSLIDGAAVAIPKDMKDIPQALRDYPVTHLSLVATQLLRLLKIDALIPRLQKLKAILLGGSAFPESLIERCIALNLPIHVSYGSTEMSSQITTTAVNEAPEKLFTAGRLLPYRELKIAGDGEILVRGETLFAGYVQGERLHLPLRQNGWFATGDLGELTVDGYLIVRGRKDNLFISGGENIHPEEIEKELLEYPGIENAVVVPVPDAEFGYRPVAFIRWQKATDADQTDLTTHLRKKLSGLKIPVRFFDWPEEEGERMKPERRALRELAEQQMAKERDR